MKKVDRATWPVWRQEGKVNRAVVTDSHPGSISARPRAKHVFRKKEPQSGFKGWAGEAEVRAAQANVQHVIQRDLPPATDWHSPNTMPPDGPFGFPSAPGLHKLPKDMVATP